MTMATFGDYARYYNLLYKDKDYAGEAAFILRVLRCGGAAPATLLDLGCGTGRHALEMALNGLAVEGVDLSETMLRMGSEALRNLGPDERPAVMPRLHQGDARTVRLDKKFEAATSLFHVMSYQTTEEDALAVLRTAKEHLVPGGLFLFDFWHGPGVLADPPVKREKDLRDAETRVRRLADPVLHEDRHVVDVHYTISISGAAGDPAPELKECHSMRYWWVEELEELSRKTGFRTVASGGWMHEEPASGADWNAWMLVESLREG